MICNTGERPTDSKDHLNVSEIIKEEDHIHSESESVSEELELSIRHALLSLLMMITSVGSLL
jgi:hypothetical protein